MYSTWSNVHYSAVCHELLLLLVYIYLVIRQIFVKFIAVLYISYNENYSVGALRTGIEKYSKVQEVLESH